MNVETKIKNYIDDRHISQKELSALTGIATAKINLSLNGKRKLAFPEYELICGVLHVPVDKFLEARMPSQEST